jgi:hypothetical protein
VCQFTSPVPHLVMLHRYAFTLVAFIVCSGCEQPPTLIGPSEELHQSPCAERPLDACTGVDQQCRIVRTRLLNPVSEQSVCPSSIEEVTCVALDSANCGAGEAEEFWKDPDGSYYWTGDGCGLPEHEPVISALRIVPCSTGEGGAGGEGGANGSSK